MRKLLATVTAVLLTSALCMAAVAEDNKSGRTQSTNGARTTTKGNLHRADFRVEGSSCVACLRRVAKALSDQKGVLKADVSIFRPYWAIVIYDAKETSMAKIEQAVKAKENNVHFAETEDKAINEMPLLIIPKGLTAGSTPPLKQ